ncbi:transmembrane and coiled-coil domain-containing protein 4 isoform X2 [Channa argus]|uniref:transmembrane and coiled-coil domain-containing protein 4 isoform X2 n=1 Tax=Channa argus TaxID=215402 RepID=UPI003520C60E
MDDKKSCMDTNFVPDPGGAGTTKDVPSDQSPEKIISRQLTEQGRFAFAALCSVSLGQLFAGPENSVFREQYLRDLVRWLDLDESVMPVMGAFLSGLGFEGSDTFLCILQAEALLTPGATPIIRDLVSFSVKDGQYDARARVLIRHVGCLLRVSPQQLEEFEGTLGERLRDAGEESEEESSRRLRRERGRKLRRYLLIGLATVGGGTVIGVTGGLAAPLVAAGAGAVLGAGGAAALGSATGIAIMASLFGAAGAGLTGYKMKKCVGAIEEFQFLPLNSGKHLHLTIAVTGWLCSGKYSILTALTWPASLLAAASVIDNPWCVCLNRSAEVGKHLAQVLRSRQQGKRPVSLIGFSLGARVIYYCLQELANDKGSEGVVEDVVLLGAPVDGSEKAWARMARVVAGKIVNGYCRGDWLLGFLYRSSAAQLSVAGLQPINVQDRHIINVDLSSVVKGHLDYMRQMDTILVAVGVPTKEVPGVSFALPQPVTITKGRVGNPNQTPCKPPLTETQNSAINADSHREESEVNLNKVAETEETSDGWDIPDISDLLDSLNDKESENQITETKKIPLTCEGGATNKSTAPALNAQYDSVEDAEADSEHISWSWDETHWAVEGTHEQKQPNL